MNCSLEPIDGGPGSKGGNSVEKFVYGALLGCGYDEFWDHKKQIFSNRLICSGKQFCYQVPLGETIYNTDLTADFLIMNKEVFSEDLIVECRRQQTSGSVHKKYPFLVWNILKTKVPILIILSGEGSKRAAKDWREKQSKTFRDLIGSLRYT